jgi:PAS domain S-box-containing protein
VAPSGRAPAGASARWRKRELLNDLVRLLSFALDVEDGASHYHGWRVGVLSYELARVLGVEPGLAFHGGLLHDVGALSLRPHLVHLARAGFSDAESRLHPARGAGLLRPLLSLGALAPVLAHHHERWDGSGFPEGLSGWEIPLASSTIAFADQLELQLRDCPPGERRARAVSFALEARGASVPEEVCEAALELLDDAPRLLDDLYEPEALARRVRTIAPEPIGLDAVSELDLHAELLWLLARVIDAKHGFNTGHSARVALYAQRIAARLSHDAASWDLVWAALLHDVGKVYVPQDVLDKTTTLTEDERLLIESHAARTREVVESLGSLAHLGFAASAHHESWDGSGYPGGLAGEAIPLVARVIAYADVFDALRNDRPFRCGSTAEEAIAAMRTMVGARLDPALAAAAFEALGDAHDVASTASDLLGFQQFFRERETRSELAMRPVQREAEIADVARWCTLRVALDGTIEEGLAALTTVTERDAARLQDHVSESDRRKLTTELARAAAGDTVSGNHVTSEGVALELVIGPFGGALVAHVRRAARNWRSMRELALVHRNFLLSSEAVMFTDGDARVVDVNHAFSRLYGWSADEIVGRTPKFLQSGRHSAALYRSMRESLVDPQVGAWSGEVVNVKKSGEQLIVQLSINAVRDEAGRVVGYVSNAVDVTAKRRAQEALEERERDLVRKNAELTQLNQFKSQIVAITSHDLRAPLASMIGLAELLHDTCDRAPVDEVRRRLGLLADSGHRLVGLVRDLLDLDKCESGTLKLTPRPIVACGLVRAVAAAASEPARVSVAPCARPLPFLGDPDRLEQALANLVGNALKFSRAQSRIEIGWSEGRAGHVAFWIDDQGPGIPQDALEAVFDRYFQIDGERTTSPRGAGIGLGLAIVRHLAELHGGRAYAENRPEGGCRFVLEVPIAGRQAESVRPTALLAGPPSDDLARAARMFAAGGLRIVHAERAVEAARRLGIEAAEIRVIDARWLAAIGGAAIEEARAFGGSLCVLHADEPERPDPRFDHELVAPLVDLELAALLRGGSSRNARHP